MEKKFSFEVPANKSERLGYKDRILSIINEVEERVRVINPDDALNRELHGKKTIDARREVQEFEPVRRDVCEAFGIPFDDDHISIYDPHRSTTGPVEQRAFRCFCVLIDSIKKEGFYGEGRIMHHALLNALIEKAREQDPNVTEEKIIAGIGATVPTYIFFKGFLSATDFREVSDVNRRVMETPLFDKNGKPVETAENWFVSGHNLEEMFPPSPESKKK